MCFQGIQIKNILQEKSIAFLINQKGWFNRTTNRMNHCYTIELWAIPHQLKVHHLNFYIWLFICINILKYLDQSQSKWLEHPVQLKLQVGFCETGCAKFLHKIKVYWCQLFKILAIMGSNFHSIWNANIRIYLLDINWYFGGKQRLYNQVHFNKLYEIQNYIFVVHFKDI